MEMKSTEYTTEVISISAAYWKIQYRHKAGRKANNQRYEKMATVTQNWDRGTELAHGIEFAATPLLRLLLWVSYASTISRCEDVTTKHHLLDGWVGVQGVAPPP